MYTIVPTLWRFYTWVLGPRPVADVSADMEKTNRWQKRSRIKSQCPSPVPSRAKNKQVQKNIEQLECIKSSIRICYCYWCILFERQKRLYWWQQPWEEVMVSEACVFHLKDEWQKKGIYSVQYQFAINIDLLDWIYCQPQVAADGPRSESSQKGTGAWIENKTVKRRKRLPIFSSKLYTYLSIIYLLFTLKVTLNHKWYEMFLSVANCHNQKNKQKRWHKQHMLRDAYYQLEKKK